MSADRVFIDTNVFTYLFDTRDTDKRRRAEQALTEETREIFVSTQVLQELYVSLTKGKTPITSSDVAERAVEELTRYSVVHVDPPLVLSAIHTGRKNKISFWDALIVCAAARAECEVLLSEALNAGQLIDGVRIEDPFGTRRRMR